MAPDANRERSAKIRDNLKRCIEEQLAAFPHGMPAAYITTWKGYLAGVFEWGELNFIDYHALDNLLPATVDATSVGDLFIFGEVN